MPGTPLMESASESGESVSDSAATSDSFEVILSPKNGQDIHLDLEHMLLLLSLLETALLLHMVYREVT